MEQFGDILNRAVLTHGDGKCPVVDTHGDREVEGLGQLDDHVSHRLRGRDGGHHGVEPAHGKSLAGGHIGRKEVVGILLLEGESDRRRTYPGDGDHEDGRTTHAAIEQRTVRSRIGKMPE